MAVIRETVGIDTWRRGGENDTLQGADGNDWLYGDEGNDWLVGEGGNDQLIREDADDFLFGSAGSDTLSEGAGNDSLQGGAGNDWLYGETGNDLLTGNAGADRFILGSGRDTVNDWNPSQGDVIDLRPAVRSYNADTDSTSDFVSVTPNAMTFTSTIAIDADGSDDGRVNFQNIGLVKDATYSTVSAMLNEGSLIGPGSSSETSSFGTSSTAALAVAAFQGPDGTAGQFMEFLGVNIKILKRSSVIQERQPYHEQHEIPEYRQHQGPARVADK